MLRRPATVLAITSEDVAAYEDRRAREALAAAERERAAAHHNKRHLQALQQQHAAARGDLPAHEIFAQHAYLDQASSSPADRRGAAAQQAAAMARAQQQQPQPQVRGMGLQQRLAAAAAQDGDEYTEQDTEMLVGSSDEEGATDVMDSSMLAAGDGSVRGRGARRGLGMATGAVAAGRGQQLQLTPTPAEAARGGRSRDERITGPRRGRGPG